MTFRELSEEVLVADVPLVQISRGDIEMLKERARSTPRRRIRICAHRTTDDPLHEMLIVHGADAYVRPHKHPGKSESIHVIEGTATVVFFEDTGAVSEMLRVGDYSSRRQFYVRIAEPVFHTLLIDSDVLVFHEVTNGPFRREDTVFAPWSPEEEDVAAATAFRRRLAEAVAE